MSEPDCFSERMLNPFHGMASVIAFGNADAVSRDGVNWSLYILRENDREAREDGTIAEIETPDYLYGTWSQKRGLKRGPVRDEVESAELEPIGQRLLAAVREYGSQLPFPARDHYELWLLDEAGAPLALLDSACSDDAIEPEMCVNWRSGQRAAVGFSCRGETAPAERIATLINSAAGRKPLAQWFWRQGGHGQGIANMGLPSGWGERILPATAFPPLLLRSEWPEAADQALVSAYLEWLAPYLLELPALTTAGRSELEQAAVKQAPVVAARHRLYPETIDRQRITAALVEAQLRGQVAEQRVPGAEEYPFYQLFSSGD